MIDSLLYSTLKENNLPPVTSQRRQETCAHLVWNESFAFNNKPMKEREKQTNNKKKRENEKYVEAIASRRRRRMRQADKEFDYDSG